jgi:hypothetical protein
MARSCLAARLSVCGGDETFVFCVDGCGGGVIHSDEIAACCEKAYPRLTVQGAQELLAIPQQADVLKYATEVTTNTILPIVSALLLPRRSQIRLSHCASHRLLHRLSHCVPLTQRGWERDTAGCFVFHHEEQALSAKDIPSLHLIGQSLGYAKELERIV